MKLTDEEIIAAGIKAGWMRWSEDEVSDELPAPPSPSGTTEEEM